MNGIDNWHRVVAAPDFAAASAILDEILADDVVFQSPVVHSPQVGKAITRKYLESAIKVLNGEGFRYLNQWVGPTSGVLEFANTIDGIEINGVDIISWNEAGQIVNFKVMVRPLKAMNMLHQHMAAQLTKPAPAQA